MEDTLIQWHPAFVAAMELELVENRKDLRFEAEHNLNTRPLEIDLLIIKKEASVELKNEIGKFFRKDNLLEYKSPGDQMDIDVLYKVIGYACLYKAYGEEVDSRQAKEITVSLVREAKPEKLFAYLRTHQMKVTNPYLGIYYMMEGFLFPVQIIVTKELEFNTHIVLKSLTKELSEESFWRLLSYAKRLKGKLEHNLIDSILEVSIQANKGLVTYSHHFKKWGLLAQEY